MRSDAAAALGAVLALVSLAACNGQGKEAAPTGFAYYDTKGNREGDAAALTGTLMIDAGCVYVTTSDSKVVPIFPLQDTTISGDQLSLRERRYTDGEAVTLGGGEQLTKPQGAVIPDACTGDSYWIVAPE